MAAIAAFLVIALLHHASAQNITTQIMLPDALFYQGIQPNQSFVGEVSTSGISTYYTINCDYNNSNFDPGPVACLPSDSYTFSANSENTKYLLPDVNLGTDPIYNTAPMATWLQTFNQTVSINCRPGTSTSDASYNWYYAPCVTTSLYNNEDANDKSIVSSTIVAQRSSNNESVWYVVTFTNPSAAAVFTNPGTAAITSPTAPIPTAAATTKPRATPGLSPTKIAPSPSPTSHQTSHSSSSSLSTGAKAGIGVGVPLGVLAFAALVLLLCRRRLRAQGDRSRMEELALRPDKGSPVQPQREYKDDVPPPDNSGVYEMEQREEPVRTGELEA